MTETPAPIEAFFKAMQRGAAAEAEMRALFAEDGVYIEPFSGKPVTHVGREAVIAAMRAGWAYPLPDMTIRIDRVDVDRGEVAVAWTCVSPGLPGGEGRGINRFLLRDGLIMRLETTLG